MTPIDQLRAMIELKTPGERRSALETFLRYRVASVSFTTAIPGMDSAQIDRYQYETAKAVQILAEMAVRQCMTTDLVPGALDFRLLFLKAKL